MPLTSTIWSPVWRRSGEGSARLHYLYSDLSAGKVPRRGQGRLWALGGRTSALLGEQLENSEGSPRALPHISFVSCQI